MYMKLYKVLKAPHITEQSSQLSQDLKQIVFKVDKGANKREIKKAVENLFNVTVVKVTTSVVKGKTKRNRFGAYKRSDYKKAFVSLIISLNFSLKIPSLKTGSVPAAL